MPVGLAGLALLGVWWRVRRLVRLLVSRVRLGIWLLDLVRVLG